MKGICNELNFAVLQDFTSNDKRTIETLDPSMQDVIGKAEGLSFFDIKLANLMYNCSKKCKNLPLHLHIHLYTYNIVIILCLCKCNTNHCHL